MKHLFIFSFVLFCLVGHADTPPPGTVKAKTFSGDGNTAITATGSSLNVNVGNFPNPIASVGVTNFPSTQAISAASLPLPTGAATSALQSTGNTSLATLITNLGSPFQSGGSIGNSSFGISGSLPNFASTPTFNLGTLNGAATAAKQPALGTAGTPSSDVLTVQGVTSMTALKVDGSAVTQPVSGTVAISNFPSPVASVGVTNFPATQPVSAVSLPLPTGAATSALQSTINSTLGSPFQAGGSIGNTSFGISGTLPAFAATPTFNFGTLNGASTASNQSTEISSLATIATNTTNAGTPVVSGTVTVNQGTQGIAAWPVLAAQSSTWSVTATQATGTNLHTVVDSSALPTGASTSAAQTTAQTSLSSIVTNTANIPAQGQALAAGSVPVVLTAAQISTLTPLTSVIVTQGTGTNLHVVNDASSAVIGKVGIDQTTPGTTNLVALAANQSVNVAQINGVAPLMGNGTTGTGSQRVTIASDNTAFTVNAQAKTPTALTVKQAAISVGTSAVRLTNDGSAPASTRVLLVAQLLSTSTANCYFGSSGVTTTSTARGVQMFAGQTLSFASDAGDYYAICDATSQTIFVTEQE